MELILKFYNRTWLSERQVIEQPLLWLRHQYYMYGSKRPSSKQHGNNTLDRVRF